MKRLVVLLLLTACATTPDPFPERCRPATIAPVPAIDLPGFVAKGRGRRVIVFVHGLGGDGRVSWTAPNGAYWPSVVAADPELAGFDVYVHQYPTSMFRKCLSLPDLTVSTRTRLLDDGIAGEYDDIIWVAHSMGGIVVRELMLLEPKLAAKTKLAYFSGSPAAGVKAANRAAPFLPCDQVTSLMLLHTNDFLQSMHNRWVTTVEADVARCAFEVPCDVVCRESATALCAGLSEPIGRSHAGIVKPYCDEDAPHIALKRALAEKYQPQNAATATTAPLRRMIVTPIGTSTKVVDVALASDGKTVVLATDNGDGNSTIHKTDLAGSFLETLFVEPFVRTLAVTPRGEIVVVSSKGIVITDPDGKSKRELTRDTYWEARLDRSGTRFLLSNISRGQDNHVIVRTFEPPSERVVIGIPQRVAAVKATWHPDGRRIAFIGNGGSAQTLDLETRATTPIGSSAGTVSEIAWNARGDYVLVFGWSRVRGFWLAAEDGQPRRIELDDRYGRYENLKETIVPNVFTAVRRDFTAELVVSNIQDGNYDVLGRVSHASELRWNDDGLIAYLNTDQDALEERAIYARQPRRLLVRSSIVGHGVTPDGRYAFAVAWSTNEVIRIDRVTLEQKVFIRDAQVGALVISPDSNWLAYTVLGPGGGGTYVMPVRGGEAVRVAWHTQFRLEFTADSSHLVWTTSGVDPRTWIAPRDGTEPPRAVAEIDAIGSSVVPTGFDVVIFPAQSPVTGHVASIADWRDGSINESMRIPKSPLTLPVWSRDGRRMYANVEGRVVMYDRNTGLNRSVLEFDGDKGAWEIALSPDERFLACVRRYETREAVLLTVVP